MQYLCFTKFLLQKIKKIKFIFDTYWTVKSSYDPIKQVRQFGERLLGIHLRDLKLNKKFLKVVSSDTEIGNGIIDFNKIIEEAHKVNCSYFVIEQKTKTPYESLKTSYQYYIDNKYVEM